MQKFLGIVQAFLPFQQLSQPRVSLDIAHLEIFALFVAPVRGDTFLGDTVHFMGANLNFDALSVGSDHAGVERLIHVDLGQGDIILESPPTLRNIRAEYRPGYETRPDRRFDRRAGFGSPSSGKCYKSAWAGRTPRLRSPPRRVSW